MQLAVAMSLMDQVAPLRKFFQPPSEAPLPMQVAMMNEQMGIDGEGTLRARCPSRSTSSAGASGGKRMRCVEG